MPSSGKTAVTLPNHSPMSNIPTEIIEEILLRVDTKCILSSCAKINKKWAAVIQRTQFWKTKLSYLGQKIPKFVLNDQFLPWSFFASLCFKNGYNKVLIENGCGEDVDKEELSQQDKREVVDGFTEPWPDYPGWSILSSGGSGWRLDKTPQGLGSFPEGLLENNCFCTSYYSCTKEQIVCLISAGILDVILDQFQPDITVTDHYNKCEAYGAVYELHACLLDGCGNVLGKSFSFRDDMPDGEGTHWRTVKHVFRNYGVGARYVKFYHGGTDLAMKMGWYGSKMTGSSVVVDYPRKMVSEERFSCKCKTKHKNDFGDKSTPKIKKV